MNAARGARSTPTCWQTCMLQGAGSSGRSPGWTWWGGVPAFFTIGIYDFYKTPKLLLQFKKHRIIFKQTRSHLAQLGVLPAPARRPHHDLTSLSRRPPRCSWSSGRHVGRCWYSAPLPPGANPRSFLSLGLSLWWALAKSLSQKGPCPGDRQEVSPVVPKNTGVPPGLPRPLKSSQPFLSPSGQPASSIKSQ